MNGKRVLLIVSGGIAAYKALELIRLLRRAGCGVTCVLTDNGGQFVTPLSLQALSESKGLYRSVLADRRIGDGPHPALARSRPAGGGAGDGEHPGEDGGRAGRRPGLHRAAGDRQAGAGGAGDECADVAASGDAGQYGDARTARRRGSAAGRGRDGLQRIRPRPAGRTAGDPGRHRVAAEAAGRGPAGRPARPGHQRPDA